MIDLEYLQQWQGRTESDQQLIDSRTVAQMAGALGLGQAPELGDALPLPWHWLFFTPVPHALATGEDGHPSKGGFLPPVPLPRRMWAGSRVNCHRPVRVGDSVTRTSRIEKITAKSGRSGRLVFVTVEHHIYSALNELLISESQDLVYREPVLVIATASNVSTPYQSQVNPQWSEMVTPDPVMLFRYSALTFNGHRIHYDRDYAVNKEGYPGLVVHGPLTASLLLNMLYTQLGSVEIKSFFFRGLSPLFDSHPVHLKGARDQHRVKLWALTSDQQLAMTVECELAKQEVEGEI